eukprot:1508870-Pleurochrysis_carterae.AAC.1
MGGGWRWRELRGTGACPALYLVRPSASVCHIVGVRVQPRALHRLDCSGPNGTVRPPSLAMHKRQVNPEAHPERLGDRVALVIVG